MNLPILYDNLSVYLEEIKKFEQLTAQEEQELAHAYKDHNDLGAAHKMVTSHLRLVVKVAFMFKGYGLPIVDLISEGNIGLMQAVKKYDPTIGCRLSTYATWWIKASIQEYIIKSWSLVKIGTTVAQKKLFFSLRKLKNKIQESGNKSLSQDEARTISDYLNVSESDVIQMDGRLTRDLSLNTKVNNDSNEEIINSIADNRANQEAMAIKYSDLNYKRSLFQQAFMQLTERERRIIEARRLVDPAITFEVLSAEFSVSKERIRQIEDRAVQKLVQSIQDMVKIENQKQELAKLGYKPLQ